MEENVDSPCDPGAEDNLGETHDRMIDDDWWAKQLGRRPRLRDDENIPAEEDAWQRTRDSRPERQAVSAAPSTDAEDHRAPERAAQVVASAEAAAVELRAAAEREASGTLEQAREEAVRVRERVDHETREQHYLAERLLEEARRLLEEARAASGRGSREDADRRASGRLLPQSITPPEAQASGSRLRVPNRLLHELYALRFSPYEPYRGIRIACANLVFCAFLVALVWLLTR
jgi:hypothetical protein